MRSGDNIDNILTKLLESFLESYEKEENILRNGSSFVFDCVDSAIVSFHIIELKRGSTYILSPERVLNKRVAIDPKNTKNNYCFAYAIIAALHHNEIRKYPQKITKLEPYVSNYNWKEINFSAEQKNLKIFERNSKDISLNVLSVPYGKKKVCPVRISEYNGKCEKEIHLLSIT